jgi:hypothetical protein
LSSGFPDACCLLEVKGHTFSINNIFKQKTNCMKLNHSFYSLSKTSIALLLLFLLGFITQQSCKKNDTFSHENQSTNPTITNNFFNFSGNVHPLVKRVANDLKKQNQKTGFISQLATQAGYPVWDKSTIRVSKPNNTNSNSFLENYEGGDTCILIPMVLNDAKYVNAFISAVVDGDSITERLYYRNDYKAYPFQGSPTGPTTSANVTTAEEFAYQMMAFDKTVFDYDVFQVKDKRLFRSISNCNDTANAKIDITINSQQTTSGSNNLIYCNETSYTIAVCTTPTREECSGTCDGCGYPVCWSIMWTIETCTGGPGNGEGGGWPSAPPSGPGGTGGGGSGGGNPNGNCVVGGLIQNGFAPPNPCNPPTGGNPLPPNDDPPLPSYIFNNITKGCLNSALNKLNSSTTNTFFKDIYNIFDSSQNLHLTFDEKTLVDAYAIQYSDIISGITYAYIDFDTTHILSCSQEWKAYVFIHEIAHAAMFSNLIQWDTSNSEHQAMIGRYLTSMANALKSAYPSLSNFDAHAICFAGFYNGIEGTPDPVQLTVAEIISKKIREKFRNNHTKEELANYGREYTESGTRGTRIPCN